MELITRGGRRRSWAAAQNGEIVAESLTGELTPTEMARKHRIGSGLLDTWRQRFLGDGLGLMTRPAPSFAQGEIASVPLQAERTGPQQVGLLYCTDPLGRPMLGPPREGPETEQFLR